VIRLGKTMLVGLLLVAVAVGFGLFLGDMVVSPNWQDAIRIAVLGGLVVVVLTNPINGLLLWIILAPYALAPYTEIWSILNIRLPPGIPDLTLERLAIGILGIVWVAQLAVGRRRIRRVGAVEILMAVFFVMALPSVVTGVGGINRTVQVLFDKFVTPFLVFVLAKNLYEEEIGLGKLGGALSVIGGYVSSMIFYEHVTGRPLFSSVGRRLSYSRSLRKIVSLLGNPAFLGTVLGMIAPIALHGLVRARSLYARALYGALFLGALLGNFLCYNRGAWLSLLVCLVMLMVLSPEYRRILLPILVVGAAVGLVYWQSISESAIVTERLTNVSAVRFRLTMLEDSEKMIRDHLLFGVGLDSYAHHFFEYGGHWETLAYDLPTPHNTFILVLATMGLACFAPYALMFVCMFLEMRAMLRRSGRDARVDRALLVSGLGVVAVYVVSALTVDLYVSVFTSLVFFLITGTVLGYVSHLRSSLGALQEARA